MVDLFIGDDVEVLYPDQLAIEPIYLLGAINYAPEPHPSGTPALDNCLAAIAHLLEEFKGRPRIEALVCTLGDRATAIEQALINVKEFRSLSTAVGQQLDELGTLYGELRGGKTDDDYRRRLEALAIVVASKGTSNEMIDALVALDNGFAPSAISLVPHYPAGLIMTAQVPDGMQEVGEDFGRVLKKIVPAGVQFVLLFEYTSSETHFVWTPDTGAGFAEEDNPIGTGGVWAEGV